MVGLFKKMDFLILLRHASYRVCIKEFLVPLWQVLGPLWQEPLWQVLFLAFVA
jgi:hypothetical protein